MKKQISTFIFLISVGIANGQFGRLTDKIANRVQNRLEDKLAEAIANEIYKKAFKPVDEAVDEAIRKSYEDSTGVDYRQAGRAYGEFLAGLNEAANKLPAEYAFDLRCDVKITNLKDKKVNDLTMLYMDNGQAIGYQTKDKNTVSTVVFDVKNEIMVMYSDEKGKKTGQVLPSMAKMAGAFVSNKIVKEESEKITFKKTGNKKTIAGYTCEEYLMESDDFTNQIFISNNFPVSYISAYGPFLQQFTPAGFTEDPSIMKGFVLYSKTADKKGKDANEYEVVKVNKEKILFNQSEYKFDKN
jgi:hypothetical protein